MLQIQFFWNILPFYLSTTLRRILTPSKLRVPYISGHCFTSHKTRISKNTAAITSYFGQASSNLTLCLQQRIENRTNRRERNLQPDCLKIRILSHYRQHTRNLSTFGLQDSSVAEGIICLHKSSINQDTYINVCDCLPCLAASPTTALCRT
jgi:hypothetical protein